MRARQIDEEARQLEREIATVRGALLPPPPPPVTLSSLPSVVKDGLLLMSYELEALREATRIARLGGSPSRPRTLAPLEAYLELPPQMQMHMPEPRRTRTGATSQAGATQARLGAGAAQRVPHELPGLPGSTPHSAWSASPTALPSRGPPGGRSPPSQLATSLPPLPGSHYQPLEQPPGRAGSIEGIAEDGGGGGGGGGGEGGVEGSEPRPTTAEVMGSVQKKHSQGQIMSEAEVAKLKRVTEEGEAEAAVEAEVAPTVAAARVRLRGLSQGRRPPR